MLDKGENFQSVFIFFLCFGNISFYFNIAEAFFFFKETFYFSKKLNPIFLDNKFDLSNFFLSFIEYEEDFARLSALDGGVWLNPFL